MTSTRTPALGPSRAGGGRTSGFFEDASRAGCPYPPLGIQFGPFGRNWGPRRGGGMDSERTRRPRRIHCPPPPWGPGRCRGAGVRVSLGCRPTPEPAVRDVAWQVPAKSGLTGFGGRGGGREAGRAGPSSLSVARVVELQSVFPEMDWAIPGNLIRRALQRSSPAGLPGRHN